METGGAPNVSDALTINGQPGDLFPCSSPGNHTIYVLFDAYIRGSKELIICQN